MNASGRVARYAVAVLLVGVLAAASAAAYNTPFAAVLFVVELRKAGAARVEEIAPDYLPQRGDRLLILGPPAGIAALRETR